MINIPTTRSLCDCERFIEGLRLLAIECNLESVDYTKAGFVMTYRFKDGSSVGGKRAWIDAGIIKEQ